MNFWSFFTGIGGMDLGLEQAGWICLNQCEINPHCRSELAKRWPNVPCNEDITRFDFSHLHPKPAECAIVGGDPCQANSNARRHGAEPEPLTEHFLRVINELCPRVVLRENPASVRRDAPWPAWKFRSALRDMGYVTSAVSLPACCVGASHRRRRVFVYATLSYTDEPRLEGHVREEVERAIGRRSNADAAGPDRWSAAPRLRGSSDGVPAWKERLIAAGNAVVVPVARVMGETINAVEQRAADSIIPEGLFT